MGPTATVPRLPGSPPVRPPWKALAAALLLEFPPGTGGTELPHRLVAIFAFSFAARLLGSLVSSSGGLLVVVLRIRKRSRFGNESSAVGSQTFFQSAAYCRTPRDVFSRTHVLKCDVIETSLWPLTAFVFAF